MNVILKQYHSPRNSRFMYFPFATLFYLPCPAGTFFTLRNLIIPISPPLNQRHQLSHLFNSRQTHRPNNQIIPIGVLTSPTSGLLHFLALYQIISCPEERISNVRHDFGNLPINDVTEITARRGGITPRASTLRGEYGSKR